MCRIFISTVLNLHTFVSHVNKTGVLKLAKDVNLSVVRVKLV